MINIFHYYGLSLDPPATSFEEANRMIDADPTASAIRQVYRDQFARVFRNAVDMDNSDIETAAKK